MTNLSPKSPDRQDRLVVKDRLDHRGIQERRERQEPPVLRELPALRDRLGVDLEVEHLNDLRRKRGASTSRGTAVAPMTEREAPDEVLATMTTTPCRALER